MGGMHTMGHLLTSKVARVAMLGAYPKYLGLFWVWEVNHEEFLETGAMKRTLLYLGGPIGTLASSSIFWLSLGLDVALLVFVALLILEFVGYFLGFFTDIKKATQEIRAYRKYRNKNRENYY